MLFGGWAEESARLIAQLEGGHELSGESIEVAVNKISESYPELERNVVTRGIATFFLENDPLYNQIKWNYSQSIYVTKVLGINQNSLALSLDIFREAQFYLDTNLLIALLEPADMGHEAVSTLALALQRFKSPARVCPITIDELEEVVARQYETFDQEVALVPVNLRLEANSVFIRKYEILKMAGEEPKRGQVFSNFDDPMRRLAERYGVVLVVDDWFDNQKSATDVIQAAILLEENARNRGRVKRRKAALHDAMLMLWVGRERDLKRRAWLVTADGSLLGSIVKRLDTSAQVITRESLLQWMSPLTSVGSEVDSFASTFAQLMRERLLPQAQLFDAADFRVLESLHLSINEMPIDDVRGALNIVRVEGARLNLSEPRDREILQQHLARYLTNPGRQYQQELVRLEEEQSAMKLSAELERDELENEKRLLEAQIEEGRLEGLRQQKVVSNLRKERQKDRSKQTIVSVANRRLFLTGLISVMYLAAVYVFVNRYGVGNNRLQKIVEYWVLFSLVVPLTVILLWLWVGRERLVVRWPRLSQLLKMPMKEND